MIVCEFSTKIASVPPPVAPDEEVPQDKLPEPSVVKNSSAEPSASGNFKVTLDATPSGALSVMPWALPPP